VIFLKTHSIIILLLLALSFAHSSAYVRTSNIVVADSTTVLDTVPLSNSNQVYLIKEGYIVCNGTLGIVAIQDVKLEFNAAKILFLPKYYNAYFINSTGFYRILLNEKKIEKLISGNFTDFWASTGQNVFYLWRNNTLYVVDPNGLVIAEAVYEYPIIAVVPYTTDYYLFVATSNGTHYYDVVYSNARSLTVWKEYYEYVDPHTFFDYWGGDKTIIFSNKTHIIYWRLGYNTKTVEELPEALDEIKVFEGISYWGFSFVIGDDDTVLVKTRGAWYTYRFSSGVIFAKTYIGMRTWGSDYPWIVVGSGDGVKIIYRDPDTEQWTSKTIFTQQINSDICICDPDLDGAEDFVFVYNNQILDVEIDQVQYTYSYRAVIPAIYFWAGYFKTYGNSAWDWDGDGLSNDREVNELQTSIVFKDTDNDGLSDYDEVYIYNTNPIMADTDGDGLNDGDEINQYNTDPAKADTDGDGLNDGDEFKYGTDPHVNDTDRDGLTDAIEVDFGTNPLRADTDGDGLNDGDEINEYRTNPLKADTDGDGLKDHEEVHTFNTNPNDPDTDNDGLSDYDEVKIYKTDPLKADTDGDGVLDGTEVQLGFNPLDPRNSPKSAWYVVTTFWWAFLSVFLSGVGLGMLIIIVPIMLKQLKRGGQYD